MLLAWDLDNRCSNKHQTMTHATTTQRPYFVNAPVDFFFIGGASIVAFALMSFFYTDARTPEVIAIAMFLMWIVNWPHFSMSTYRLYQSKSQSRQYPFTSYVVPWVVIAGLILSFAYPEEIAPYFVKLFILWSPYHFSGQTIGITMIYARRSGVQLGPWERRALHWFVYGTFLLSSIRAETSREGFQYYGIQYPSFGVPDWAVSVTELGFWFAAILFFGSVILWIIRNRKWIPAIVLLPAVTQYVWFIQSIYMPSYQEFVPLFHSLQYVLIAWALQLKVKLDQSGAVPSGAFAWSETLRWGSINLVGGAVLFALFPAAGAVAGFPPFFAEGVIIAAVQIHHFFVDGVIWKIRYETVAHPLMMHISDVTGKRIKPAPLTT